MESLTALLSSLPLKHDHHRHHSKPHKTISNLQKTATILRITTANFRARLNSNNNSTHKTVPLLRISPTHFANPLQNHQLILKIASFLNLSLNFAPAACFAAETVAVSNELVSDKINLESILISIDDFFNRNPFFVSGVTFIWLVVIPLAQEYLKKYKFIAAIDAFRKLRDDANTQLLDVRDNRSLMYLGSPNLRILNKKAVQVHFVEGEEDDFVKKVLERFKDPGNTTLCIIDNFDGNSLKVAELLFKNGFKEAYAIKGGLRGKDGWQAIQETLLPQSVHVFPKKEGMKLKQLEVNKKELNKETRENGQTPSVGISGTEDPKNGYIGTLDSTPRANLSPKRSLSPYPNYPDMKPPSSPTPSKPQ